jgi:hypothetical protein
MSVSGVTKFYTKRQEIMTLKSATEHMGIYLMGNISSLPIHL